MTEKLSRSDIVTAAAEVKPFAPGDEIACIWPAHSLDLAFVLGVCEQVRYCALCHDEVHGADGVVILLIPGGGRELRKPGLNFHARCAEMLAGAIGRDHAEVDARAAREIDEAEARFGMGNA